MFPLPLSLLLVFLLPLLPLFLLLAAVVVRGGRRRGGAVRVGGGRGRGGGVLEQLLKLLDSSFFFIPFVLPNYVIHWVFMSHSELLEFLVAFDEERTFLISCPVAVALASPALHHFHLLPKRHPQPPGWGVCQEAPGCFISWFSRNTVLWFFFMLLDISWWGFLIESLDVFQFLDFLVEFFRVCLEFLHIMFGCLVSLVVSSVLLVSCSLSVRHCCPNANKLCLRNTIKVELRVHEKLF